MARPTERLRILAQHLPQGLDTGQETETFHAHAQILHGLGQARKRHGKRRLKHFRQTGVRGNLRHGVVLLFGFITQSLTAPGERRLPQLFNIDRDIAFLELDNNTAERSMRPIALGRKNYLFMGSEGGGKAAAIAYTLIETAKLNSVDPQAWLTDTLGRIADHKITRLSITN